MKNLVETEQFQRRTTKMREKNDGQTPKNEEQKASTTTRLKEHQATTIIRELSQPNIQSTPLTNASQHSNMVFQRSILALVSLLLTARTTTAFTIAPQASAVQRRSRSSPSQLLAESWDGTKSTGGGTGGIEQIEYKIFPDGRIEETVRGIKGNNCHKVTDQISAKLGEVVSTTPTEEMYEQEVVLDQTIKQTEGGSGDSWEGGSSW
jgi:hypothetical protein